MREQWLKKRPDLSDSQVYCPWVESKTLSSTFVGLDLLIHKLIIGVLVLINRFFFAFREHLKPQYIVLLNEPGILRES